MRLGTHPAKAPMRTTPTIGPYRHYWILSPMTRRELSEVTFLIARLSDDNWVLSMLGAGSLQHLLNYHPEFLEAIGEEVEANANLHLALLNVWRLDAMSDETWAEVQRLACSTLAEVLRDLGDLPDDLAIFARKPWTPTSLCRLKQVGNASRLDLEEVDGLPYFLEVSRALDRWEGLKAAGLSDEGALIDALIEYAKGV